MTGRLAAAAYVATVAGLAGFGFATGSTVAILLAAALALPSGVPAVVGFYAAYGLLALVPGANPSSSSGSASCTADGVCASSSTGDAATWFLVTTDVLGVLALAVAATANVLLVGLVRRPRRAPSGSAAGAASSPGRPTRAAGTRPRRPGPAGWS